MESYENEVVSGSVWLLYGRGIGCFRCSSFGWSLIALRYRKKRNHEPPTMLSQIILVWMKLP